MALGLVSLRKHWKSTHKAQQTGWLHVDPPNAVCRFLSLWALRMSRSFFGPASVQAGARSSRREARHHLLRVGQGLGLSRKRFGSLHSQKVVFRAGGFPKSSLPKMVRGFPKKESRLPNTAASFYDAWKRLPVEFEGRK